jgi:hypothetical protein
MSYDVFISYSSKDKHAADAACAVLERNGIRCWIAPRDVLPGMTWGAAIVAAIHQVKLFVLVFSGSANTSPQIEREVERAINDGLPVIPFRIENVKPSNSLEYFISASHWLDAFTQPMEQHLETLAQVVRRIIELKQDKADGAIKPADRPAAAAGAPAETAAPPPHYLAAGPAVSPAQSRSPWLFVVAAIALVAGAGIAALVFKMAPQRTTVQASVVQPAAVQSPSVQLASAPPANIPPPGAQAPAAPPASAPPDNAAPPVPQTASAAPAAASPPAPQPSAVSLSGRWNWLADCSSTRWHGKFDIAAAAQGQFTGNFAGTVWYDVGTITDGKMDGAGVSFTRTAGAYVQYWKGQVAPGRMQGSLTYGNETCSWEASRD